MTGSTILAGTLSDGLHVFVGDAGRRELEGRSVTGTWSRRADDLAGVSSVLIV